MEPSYFAGFAVGSFYYFLSYREKRKENICLLVGLLIEILLTFSSSAYVALVFAGMIFLASSKEKKLKFEIIMASVVGFAIMYLFFFDVLDLVIFSKASSGSGVVILTSVLGYELKTAVGTSVFIMTFTALTGAVSHFAIGGAPDWTVFALCVLFTLVWARIAAVFANKASPKTLNRATGVVLVILGVAIMLFNVLT